MATLRAVIPYMIDEEHKHEGTRAIAEILTLSEHIYAGVEFGRCPDLPIQIATIHKKDIPRSPARIAFARGGRAPQGNVRLTLRIPGGADAVRRDYPNLPRRAIERITANLYTYEFVQRIGDLALALNIAKPGVVHLDSPNLYRNGRFFSQDRGYSWIIGEAVAFGRHLGWPPIKELDVSAVWTWLTSLPGFNSGMVPGRIGRALSAVTFLIRSSPSDASPGDFVWALLALEALYCVGGQGSKQQLMDKSAVFLGQRPTGSKKFAQMYDYRSRFVHGDIDFPHAYLDTMDDKMGDFLGDASDCWCTATSLLIATLQRLCESGMSDLQFEYSLKELG